MGKLRIRETSCVFPMSAPAFIVFYANYITIYKVHWQTLSQVICNVMTRINSKYSKTQVSVF